MAAQAAFKVGFGPCAGPLQFAKNLERHRRGGTTTGSFVCCWNRLLCSLLKHRFKQMIIVSAYLDVVGEQMLHI